MTSPNDIATAQREAAIMQFKASLNLMDQPHTHTRSENLLALARLNPDTATLAQVNPLRTELHDQMQQAIGRLNAPDEVKLQLLDQYREANRRIMQGSGYSTAQTPVSGPNPAILRQGIDQMAALQAALDNAAEQYGTMNTAQFNAWRRQGFTTGTTVPMQPKNASRETSVPSR